MCGCGAGQIATATAKLLYAGHKDYRYQTEREKERGECSSRLDRITFTFFPTVSSSSFIANATPDVKIISLLYLNQFWFPPDLLAYLNNSRKPKKGNAKATR